MLWKVDNWVVPVVYAAFIDDEISVSSFPLLSITFLPFLFIGPFSSQAEEPLDFKLPFEVPLL
jgi:hypothetical protein